MPAPAVIPAPRAYINVAAVKKLVVGFRGRGCVAVFGFLLVSLHTALIQGSYILWERLLVEAALTGGGGHFRSDTLHKARPQMLL